MKAEKIPELAQLSREERLNAYHDNPDAVVSWDVLKNATSKMLERRDSLDV